MTGGAHGIGQAIATALLAKGDRVVVIDQAEAPSGATDFIKAKLGEVDPDDLASEVQSRFGTPNRVVHNVGCNSGRGLLDISHRELLESYDVNVATPVILTQRWATGMGEGDSILFITSLHDRFTRMNPDYSASKAALRMIVKEMAQQWSPRGIRINALAPGAIDTWSDNPGEPNQADDFIPMRRVGLPEEIAQAAEFLLDSDRSGYITGASLDVDGGLGTYSWWDNRNS